jgi:DHA1 family tetracycline resistance protein-like MFS transporter
MRKETTMADHHTPKNGGNRSLLLLFSVVFMDMVGFGFIIPILPDFAERYGGTPTVVGLLMAVYALGQFVAAPVLGRLSDRYGRRPIFLVSIAGTMISMLILGFARSVPMLFASRIVGGLSGGNVTVAQSYVADVTDERNRARGLGFIGAAFGMGFILGPLFGGLLVNFGFSVPPFVAAALSALNLGLVIFTLPESLSREQRTRTALRTRRRFSIALLRETLGREPVGSLLVVTYFYGLAFTMFEMIFSLFVQQRLGLSPQARSYILAYIGVLIALVQGGGIGFLTKRFAEERLMLVSAAVMTVALGFWAFTSSTLYLVIVLAPLSIAAGIITTLLRSLLSKAVPPEEIGGTLGLSNSLDSLNRIVSPAVGGLMIGRLATWAPGVLGAVVLGGVTVLIWVRLIRGREHNLSLFHG